MPEPKISGVAKAPEKEALPDIDQILARANAAIQEAERAAAAAVEASTRVKRVEIEERQKKQERRVKRTEEAMGAVNKGSGAIEDFEYEWIFAALQSELGEATTKPQEAALQALEKANDAIKSLDARQVDTSAFHEARAGLVQPHAQILGVLQAEAKKGLDRLHKKLKGEASEIETSLRELLDSPLVRGVRSIKDRDPKERERGLREGIKQELFGLVVEQRLRPAEETLEARKRITEGHQALVAIIEDYNNVSHLDQLNGAGIKKWMAVQKEQMLPFFSASGFSKYDLENTLPSPQNQSISHLSNQLDALKRILKQQGSLEMLKDQVEHERLALATNTMIVDAVLEGATEADMERTFADLRLYLAQARRNTENGHALPDDRPKMKSILAQSLIQGLVGFGARLGPLMTKRQNAVSFDNTDIYDHWMKPEEGLLGEASMRFRTQHSVYGESPIKTLFGDAKVASNYLTVIGAEAESEHQVRQHLDSGSFVPNPRLLAIKQAYEIVARPFITKTERAQEPRTLTGVLSKVLLERDWSLLKGGGLLAPGQEQQKIERAFATLLERLSAPQKTGEVAFDVRGPDGEFIAVTAEQGADLVRRVRRDTHLAVEVFGKKDSEREAATSVTVAEANRLKDAAKREAAEQTQAVALLKVEIVEAKEKQRKTDEALVKAREEARRAARIAEEREATIKAVIIIANTSVGFLKGPSRDEILKSLKEKLGIDV